MGYVLAEIGGEAERDKGRLEALLFKLTSFAPTCAYKLHVLWDNWGPVIFLDGGLGGL